MRKFLLAIIFVFVATLGTGTFMHATQTPLNESDAAIRFIVAQGEGARNIAARLMEDGLIRSSLGFYVMAFFTGSAFDLKPGVYDFVSDMNMREILKQLVAGPDNEQTIVIVEGATLYEIDTLLSERGVLYGGELIAYDESLPSDEKLEGKLFPDTYRFFLGSSAEEVANKLKKNFDEKATSLLPKDTGRAREILILASMLEREVPDQRERRIVAGILLKRINAGMPLQVDATICYSMERSAGMAVSCNDISAIDIADPSPYNTYRSKGWPPGPIGNPGIQAIEAAQSPIKTPYWFYLSDPKTKKTIFATTLDEHNQNRVKYLAK